MKGVVNVGNTCFAGCVLQALSGMPSFVAFVKEQHQRSKGKLLTLTTLHTAITEMQSDGLPLNPGRLFNCPTLAHLFDEGIQHDSHEFFITLMDAINEEISKISLSVPLLSRPSLSFSTPPNPFYGTQGSHMKCSFQHSSITLHSFYVISFPIPWRDGFQLTLQNCLEDYLSSQEVEHRCGYCPPAENGVATLSDKKMFVGRAPTCLALHLSRTAHSFSSPTANKVDTFIPFPVSLDISPFCQMGDSKVSTEKNSLMNFLRSSSSSSSSPSSSSSSSSSATSSSSLSPPPKLLYSLIAVVVHLGGAYGGHYITYRRGEGRNSEKWYVANDGVIRETTREYVLKQPAYLLFYEKMNESG